MTRVKFYISVGFILLIKDDEFEQINLWCFLIRQRETKVLCGDAFA